jgi:hypothetical protein
VTARTCGTPQSKVLDMTKLIHRVAATAALVLVSSSALAHHNHVTVRTPTGTPGEALQIAVGYYEKEVNLSLDPVTGQILDGADIFVVELSEMVARGPLAGLYTGEGLSLTSDFYAKEGLLTGADVYYEMVSVVPVEGDPTDAAWCTTDENTGEIEIEALSNAGSRIERSLHVGVGGHPHGQLMAIATEGEYDITLIAWDLNGVFADSQPFTVRVHAHEITPDFNEDGMVDGADLGILLGAWGTHEADLNGDETTDGADLGILLGAWM